MEVPVMLSFGNAGGLRNFQLHEVQSTALLDDVLDQCGPENWRSNMSSLTVKISATKSGGFDKFSLRNSVSLVLRVMKTEKEKFWKELNMSPLLKTKNLPIHPFSSSRSLSQRWKIFTH